MVHQLETIVVNGSGTHHLASFRALLDIHHELLLLLLKLGSFSIELALCLGEGALMLAQPLCRGGCPSK